MSKDERRIISKDGHKVEHGLRRPNNKMTAGLIDLQAEVIATGNERLAKKINELMAYPLEMNIMLDMWAAGDIDGLITWIEGRK